MGSRICLLGTEEAKIEALGPLYVAPRITQMPFPSYQIAVL